MCVVSMIMDHHLDKWRELLPQYPLQPQFVPKNSEPAISDAEIREFRKLLERAREYDKKNNEPDCEMESKKQQIRELAEKLGVEIKLD